MTVHRQNGILSWCLQCSLLICLLLMGCDLRRIGPALPELFGKEYLEEHGYGTNVIKSVLEYDVIDHAMFLQLSCVPDVSVRHMLGRNSHLTRDERAILLKDKIDYVRAGVAMNPCVSRDEILVLISQESRYSPVLHGLAMNPFVPQDILMKLYHEYQDLVDSFAKNVNCPTVIVQEIEGHGTSQGKKMLAWAQTRKHEGAYRYLGCKLPTETHDSRDEGDCLDGKDRVSTNDNSIQ